MNGAPLRVAVLSFAHTHAESYVRALVRRDDVELVTTDPDDAWAADSSARGAELAAQWGVDYLESYERVFEWGPDAVVITAENARHRALVERAAAAGAAILCEKPLATTVDDARAVVDSVKAAGVTLMTAYPVRFSPVYQELRSRVRHGDLGNVIGIRGINNGRLPQGERAWFTDAEAAGGGALVDHVVHCADLIDDLTSQRARTVRAVSNGILHADRGVSVETAGLVTIEYADGLIATIDCSWSCADSAPTWGGLTLQVVGTAGTATIAPFSQHISGYDRNGAVWVAGGDDLDAMMIDEFVMAARSGRQAEPGGDVGLRTVEIMDGARRSAVDGQPVSLR